MFLLLTLNIFHTFFYRFYCWLWTSKCYLGCSHHIVTSQLICFKNQLTSFYIIGTLVNVKALMTISFLLAFLHVRVRSYSLSTITALHYWMSFTRSLLRFVTKKSRQSQIQSKAIIIFSTIVYEVFFLDLRK